VTFLPWSQLEANQHNCFCSQAERSCAAAAAVTRICSAKSSSLADTVRWTWSCCATPATPSNVLDALLCANSLYCMFSPDPNLLTTI
jgi:hypothetical protein